MLNGGVVIAQRLDIGELAAELLGAPICLVSLVAESRQWFKSRVGLDATETPRDQAFCAYAILSDGTLVIEDATSDQRTQDNPLVTGGPRIRSYAGHPLVLEDGGRVGTLCVIDIERRRFSAQQLKILKRLAGQVSKLLQLYRAKADAERASKAKSDFLANMSHEIRTPMTAILGYADLIAEHSDIGDDAARRLDAIDVVRRNGRHLLALINDILDISKIESGRMAVERIEFDPTQIVSEVAATASAQAAAKQIGLSVAYETPIPERICSDPTRLRQILLNLLSNAVKFTEEGSVGVRVSCDPAAQSMVFSVSDTGIGLTEENRKRIARFEAFTQADSSTTRRFGGTGLGLRISHALAEQLGGELGFESEAGRGSTFWVTIDAGDLEGVRMITTPLGSQGLGSDAGAGRIDTAADDRARPLIGARVLVVEDGPDNQRLIRFVLEKAGAEVSVCDNGRVAVDLLSGSEESELPDLILMDMQMPEMDGYEATGLLREMGYRHPIIALTAHSMVGDHQRCLDCGCDRFLSKPFDRAGLIDACLSLLPGLRSDTEAA